jgi:hypothetical protein
MGSEVGERFSEERSAEIVAASFAGAADPRLRQVLGSLVRHLHAPAEAQYGAWLCGAVLGATTTARQDG